MNYPPQPTHDEFVALFERYEAHDQRVSGPFDTEISFDTSPPWCPDCEEAEQDPEGHYNFVPQWDKFVRTDIGWLWATSDWYMKRDGTKGHRPVTYHVWREADGSWIFDCHDTLTLRAEQAKKAA